MGGSERARAGETFECGWALHAVVVELLQPSCRNLIQIATRTMPEPLQCVEPRGDKESPEKAHGQDELHVTPASEMLRADAATIGSNNVATAIHVRPWRIV